MAQTPELRRVLNEKIDALDDQHLQILSDLIEHINSPADNDYRHQLIDMLNSLSDEQCQKFLPSLIKLLTLTNSEKQQSLLFEIEEEMYLIARFFRSYLPLP